MINCDIKTVSSFAYGTMKPLKWLTSAVTAQIFVAA